LSRQPVGGRNKQPITTGVASEDTAESIHFAPPLTQASALGQSYGGFGAASNEFQGDRYSIWE
jgi:hypothetical protein